MTTPPTNSTQPYSTIIARFFYWNGIDFDFANSKSFKMMVEAIGMYGVDLKYNQMLQDLVIKYNQTLKEQFESDVLIDSMVMDGDIDTNNPWLCGDEDEEEEDDEVIDA